jgi:succinate-semialdehyde dehydrogenase/glutarate-semialdehyde dehydrogenase
MSELVSTNPGDAYSVIGEVSISDDAEIAAKVAQANAAKTAWKELGIDERIELLRPISEELAGREEEIAQLICQEVGKPISQSRGEAKNYVKEFNWFLDNAPQALQDEVTHEDDKSIHKIVYEPHGVTAAITPWNFPFGMAIWGIVPNLIAGNPVIHKTSEECPLTGKLIEAAFLNHDLPEGVFAEVYGAGDVGEKLSKSDVDFIWFTGSTRTGKSLYKTAADKLIEAVLEMGGSNPGIVFEDADIKTAASLIYDGRFYNCGQVCDAIKRLIVHTSIKDEFLSALTAEIESKKIGQPADESTDIGSLVAKRQLELVTGQVDDSVAQGATRLFQAQLPDKLRGAYYPPTILDAVTKEMRVWSEEVFGPILPVMTFQTEEEAIELANDTPYGLGSRVISGDRERALRVASKINAGTVEVNEGDRWLTCNPFGGYKNSGIGREHGVLGFRELCQVKLISSSK